MFIITIMRRKSRYGIFSNQSIKRCRRLGCCKNMLYCTVCRGLCRKFHGKDQEYHDHKEESTYEKDECCFTNNNRRHKAHQHGTGKLGKGYRFEVYDRWWHKYVNEVKKKPKKRYFKGAPKCDISDFYDNLGINRLRIINSTKEIREDLRSMMVVEEMMRDFKQHKHSGFFNNLEW
jgi:hypothetical protein